MKKYTILDAIEPNPIASLVSLSGTIYYGTTSDDLVYDTGASPIYQAIFTDAGNDYVSLANSVFANGGTGFDQISFVNATHRIAVNVVDRAFSVQATTITDFEMVTGSNYGDVIDASQTTSASGKHTYYGGRGADTIIGGTYDDVINGGNDADTLFGGSGYGVDTLRGGYGNDVLYGGYYATLYGDQDDDTFILSDGQTNIISGGEGYDTVSLASPNGGTITFNNTTGSVQSQGSYSIFTQIEAFKGSAQDDIFIAIEGTSFPYKIDGGAGIDTLSFAGSQAIIIDLDDVLYNVDNVERIVGTAYNDVIASSYSTRPLLSVDAGAGNDYIFASRIFADTLYGGAGDDNLISYFGEGYTASGALIGTQMFGGDGNDMFACAGGGNDVALNTTFYTYAYGENGDDQFSLVIDQELSSHVRIDGGAQFDTLTIALSINGLDYITSTNWNLTAGESILSFYGNPINPDPLDQPLTFLSDEAYFTNIEKVVGSASSDSFYVADVDIFIDGGYGYDNVSYTPSSHGVEVDLSSPASSLINIENLAGSRFNDILQGDGKNNGISGDSGNDIIHGLGGDDTISGGSGQDYLYGDAGNDTISLDDSDVASGGLGNDLFRLSIISNNVITDFEVGAGKDALNIDSLLHRVTNYFNVTNAQLQDYFRFVQSGSDAYLQIDTDGSGALQSWQDVLLLKGDAGVTLQQLLANNQIII